MLPCKLGSKEKERSYTANGRDGARRQNFIWESSGLWPLLLVPQLLCLWILQNPVCLCTHILFSLSVTENQRVLTQFLPYGQHFQQYQSCIKSGVCVALKQSSQEEILHVQYQRNPSKMVGTGVAVEEIPYVQEQKSSPSKTVEGQIHIQNQTPFPPETLRGSKQTLCTPEPGNPTETGDRISLECLLRVRVGSGLPQGQGLWMRHGISPF